MSAVGSLVFCTDCGNLLESSTGNKNNVLTCDCCGAENQGQKKLLDPCQGLVLKNNRYFLENVYDENKSGTLPFNFTPTTICSPNSGEK
jgi:DNA-directed RNA polymerase subunit M/transcription elongation factor TFIIS